MSGEVYNACIKLLWDEGIKDIVSEVLFVDNDSGSTVTVNMAAEKILAYFSSRFEGLQFLNYQVSEPFDLLVTAAGKNDQPDFIMNLQDLTIVF